MFPMYAIYQNKPDFEVYVKSVEHVPPHLHEPMELVYLRSGSMEIGSGTNLFHMEAGDLALIFPQVIHHYQNMSGEEGHALFIHSTADHCPPFRDALERYTAQDPVIPKERVSDDIIQALICLENLDDRQVYHDVLMDSYLQIILGRIFPMFHLVQKDSMGSDDLIYRTVEYIARNHTREVTLTSMAKDLYVSPYALSRLFSSTFHMNFNRYLNQTRLRDFVHLLRLSNQSITEACMNAGFDSQRTMNRVFREEYHMSPSEYRREIIKNRMK
jgi:AraC-like DNA-binding protein